MIITNRLRLVAMPLLCLCMASVAYSQQGNTGVSLVVEYEETPLYEGMSMEYILKLCIDPMTEVQSYLPQAELEIEGCSIDYSPNVPEKVVTETDNEGNEYLSIVIDRIYITPEQGGGYTIPALAYDVEVLQGAIVEHPVWGRQMVYNPVSLTLKTEPLYFVAQSLPGDAPSGFNGVMGDFTYRGGCNADTTNVGSLLTLTLTLSGLGNPSDINLPDITASALSLPCEISEPHRTLREQKAGNQMMGVVRYTYTIRPLQTGTLYIDAPEFVYLDLLSGEYLALQPDIKAVEIR